MTEGGRGREGHTGVTATGVFYLFFVGGEGGRGSAFLCLIAQFFSLLLEVRRRHTRERETPLFLRWREEPSSPLPFRNLDKSSRQSLFAFLADWGKKEEGEGEENEPERRKKIF